MEIKRSCYLVYVKGKRTIREVRKIKGIDVFYYSNRSKYLTIYFDTEEEENILKALKDTKGVIKCEETLLDQPQTNINI